MAVSAKLDAGVGQDVLLALSLSGEDRCTALVGLSEYPPLAHLISCICGTCERGGYLISDSDGTSTSTSTSVNRSINADFNNLNRTQEQLSSTARLWNTAVEHQLRYKQVRRTTYIRVHIYMYT